MPEQQDNSELMNVDAMLEEDSKGLATQGGGELPIISTKGGVFTFPDGVVVEGPLKMVAVASRRGKHLWALPYDLAIKTGQRNGVVCAAHSTKALEYNMTPFQGAPQKKAASCDNCPENKWEQQGKSRVKIGECKDYFLFAVMAPDLSVSQMYQIRSSATGIKESATAIATMKAQYGHPVKGIVTFGFTRTTQGSARLTIMGTEPNPRYKEHAAYIEKADSVIDIEPRWLTTPVASNPDAPPEEYEGPKSSGRKPRSAAA